MQTRAKLPYFRTTTDGIILEIHLQPKASKDAIVGPHGDRLKVTITAPAIENRANQHLIKFLAKYFGLAQKQVRIVRGEHSREKTVLFANIDLCRLQTLVRKLNQNLWLRL